LELGIEPVPTVTLTSDSLVPLPKLLSVWPVARSTPVVTPPWTFTQSVLPAVLTTKFPSLPSNVLPGKLAPAVPVNPAATASKTAAPPSAIRFMLKLVLDGLI
jgi:hypothetical protein